MKIQLQPTRWSCLVTSFAVVTDIPVDKLIATIKHDGSEIIFPDLLEPKCRRAFHWQEIALALEQYDYWVSYYERFPLSRAQGSPETYQTIIDLDYLMKKYDGVMIAQIKREYPHSIAWDHHEQLCYDPNGTIHEVKPTRIISFFPVIKIG